MNETNTHCDWLDPAPLDRDRRDKCLNAAIVPMLIALVTSVGTIAVVKAGCIWQLAS